MYPVRIWTQDLPNASPMLNQSVLVLFLPNNSYLVSWYGLHLTFTYAPSRNLFLQLRAVLDFFLRGMCASVYSNKASDISEHSHLLNYENSVSFSVIVHYSFL